MLKGLKIMEDSDVDSNNTHKKTLFAKYEQTVLFVYF